MTDYFSSHQKSLDSPADIHFSISTSDSEDLAIIPRAIRVGVGGTMAVVDKAGTEITYTVIAGEVFTFRGVKIKATGTTATGLVGWL